MIQSTLLEAFSQQSGSQNNSNPNQRSNNQKPNPRKMMMKFKNSFSRVSKEQLDTLFQKIVKDSTTKTSNDIFPDFPISTVKMYNLRIFSSSFKTSRYGFAAFILPKQKKFLVFTKKLCLIFQAKTGLLHNYKVLPQKAIPKGYSCFVLSQNEDLILMSQNRKKIETKEKLKIYDIKKNKIIFEIDQSYHLKSGCNYYFQDKICMLKIARGYKIIKSFDYWNKRKSNFFVKSSASEKDFNVINLQKSRYLVMKPKSVHLVNSKNRKSLIIFNSDENSRFRPIGKRNYNFHQSKKFQGLTRKFVSPVMFSKRPTIHVKFYLGKILVVGSSFVLNIFLQERICITSWRGDYMKDFSILKKENLFTTDPEKISRKNNQIFGNSGGLGLSISSPRVINFQSFESRSTQDTGSEFFMNNQVNFKTVREFENRRNQSSELPSFRNPEPRMPNFEQLRQTRTQELENSRPTSRFPSRFSRFEEDEYVEYEDEYFDGENYEFSNFQHEEEVMTQETQHSVFTQFGSMGYSNSSGSRPKKKVNVVGRINKLISDHFEKGRIFDKEIEKKSIEMSIRRFDEKYFGFKNKVVFTHGKNEVAYLGIGPCKKIPKKYDLENLILSVINIRERLNKCFNICNRDMSEIRGKHVNDFTSQLKILKNLCGKLKPCSKKVLLKKIEEWTHVDEREERTLDLSNFGFTRSR